VCWCECAGEYLIYVKFNDQQIPDSPFKVCVLPVAGDSQRLHVHDLQQLGVQVSTLNSTCTNTARVRVRVRVKRITVRVRVS